jgi:hypothetical protein
VEGGRTDTRSAGLAALLATLEHLVIGGILPPFPELRHFPLHLLNLLLPTPCGRHDGAELAAQPGILGDDERIVRRD